MKRFLITTLASLLLVGCASVHSMPQSANEVSFELSEEGRTGWSEYQDTIFVKGVDKRTAYLAAKAGLADAGFTIKKASFENLYAVGEHGMTAYDWNVIAGVYIKEEPGKGVWIKTLVEGSKDVGFWGDMTASSWTQNILKGVREYIRTESQIENPDRNIFN
jgi:hypothetical protein